jgi:cytochrome c553
MKNLSLFAVSLLFSSLTTSVAFGQAAKSPTASISMGKGVYGDVKVSNSCAFCHGAVGEGGSIKTAAKLSEPKTWKIYKILGGDAAFAKDKADFLKKMKDATEHLIVRSAVAHNVTYKAKNPWFDVAKGGGAYDAQMLGLTAAPSKAWLAKFKDKGVTPQIAAESVYLYVQSLDKQGLFK